MGSVSADDSGLSGRYHGVVYGFDTRTGRLIAKSTCGAATRTAWRSGPSPAVTRWATRDTCDD